LIPLNFKNTAITKNTLEKISFPATRKEVLARIIFSLSKPIEESA
jgi:hypothetical protein